MVRCALWCEDQLGLKSSSIGRAGLDRRDSCTLEASGSISLCRSFSMAAGSVSELRCSIEVRNRS